MASIVCEIVSGAGVEPELVQSHPVQSPHDKFSLIVRHMQRKINDRLTQIVDAAKSDAVPVEAEEPTEDDAVEEDETPLVKRKCRSDGSSCHDDDCAATGGAGDLSVAADKLL